MNCRGDDDIDAKRSRPSIGKTRDGPREERTRAFVWDPISGLHQGQQPKRLHSKAEYMAAPERFAELSDFSLAPRAPSIHGPSLLVDDMAFLKSGRGLDGRACLLIVDIWKKAFSLDSN